MVHEADYFDGISSKKEILRVEFDENGIYLPSKEWRFLADDIKISPKIPGVPQNIELGNGAYLVFDKNITIKTPSHFIFKLENKLSYVLISLVFLVLFVGFMLTFGADTSAKFISAITPQSALDYPSKQAIEQLKDYKLISDTNLSQKQQAYIRSEFQKISPKDLHLKLHFYSSTPFGANAFALPSGDIILLDGLVKLDHDPKLHGVVGVLAHEIGHVAKKHSLQNLVKTSIVGALSAYFIGDFSSFLAGAATSIVGLSYSREFEKEADEFAVTLLKKQNYSSKPLAKLFKELGTGVENKFLSSHPLTKDRIKFFEKGGN